MSEAESWSGLVLDVRSDDGAFFSGFSDNSEVANVQIGLWRTIAARRLARFSLDRFDHNLPPDRALQQFEGELTQHRIRSVFHNSWSDDQPGCRRIIADGLRTMRGARSVHMLESMVLESAMTVAEAHSVLPPPLDLRLQGDGI